MSTLTIVLAIILGAAWRRMFGSDRPDWATPGYRGGQALIGFLVLMGLLIWYGASPAKAMTLSGLALGFMTSIAQAIPHVWAFWNWFYARVGLPRGVKFFSNPDGSPAPTAYAEASCGAIVWCLAAVL